PAEAAALEGGRIVKRRVVRAHFDPSFMQHGVNEILAAQAELLGIYLDWVEVKDVFVSGQHGGGREAGDVFESGREGRGGFGPALIQGVEFSQLHGADGALSVGKAKVVAAIIEILPPEALAHWEFRFVERTILSAGAINAGAMGTVQGDAFENGRIIG